MADRWKSGVWLGKSDLTDEHFVRTDDGVEYARSVRRFAEHNDSQSTTGQKRTSSQSPRPHRSRGRQQPMVQQIPEQFQKHMNTRNRMRKRTTTIVRMRYHPTSQTTRIMTWRETLPEPDTTATSSSSRGEKLTETHENAFVKKRQMTKSPRRPITLVPPPEDLVKRRPLKKTDMRNDQSVMNVNKDLFFVVNTLTKDEGHEMPKLTVLDNHEEMMKGRQKELNSLKEMGAMTVVKGMKQLAKERFEHDG